jgi:membrane protein YdbS with pleckstrin-like domain
MTTSDPRRDLPRNTEAVSARDVAAAAAVPPVVDDRPHRPADDREEVYYEGSPMVRGEVGMFFLWTVLGLALIAVPFLWHYLLGKEWWPWFVTAGFVVVGLLLILIPVLVVRQYRYRISNYRIDYEKGLLGKKIETLELWHVDDIEFQQSFFDRIMGVGQITVFSNDKTTPRLELKGLPNPRPLFESLKQRVIAVKRQRGVIKMDVG